ncbi:helix-turn-helix transcriptional regulator [Peptostreptococcus russellii]|uniref:Putative transcriptional regulator n=1 Tax=Peptostreptococcus russellii TaxID=215200 RepID=A0A1H8GUS2_9FIRM|nr:helix-turn-helix transcriptional regulator [Peptostreptococcus russellii]MBC2578014.1 helix-turn-helix transcriptional regulator [Peptostreptococcus russellii]SEN47474.1 putative transcriptional regulator [Peptostreptococcus russellii]
MAIIVNLDVVLAKQKKTLKELSEAVGISNTNLSILKTGKSKGIRFSTLNKICKFLQCSPGDILEYVEDDLDNK